MNLKQPWLVATATLAAVGFGNGVAYACEEPSPIYQQQVPMVELPDTRPDRSASDSPNDADVRPKSGGSTTAPGERASTTRTVSDHAI